MNKFLPICRLVIEVEPDANGVPQANLTIPPDVTIEFQIDRRSLASSQQATFRVLNLNDQTRGMIEKDPYAWTQSRAIQFFAGYQGEAPIPMVFNGRVTQAVSYKPERGTEPILEITAYDGGFSMTNGFISQTIAGGTSVRQLLASVAGQLPGTTGSPIIGSFPGILSRGAVLFGNTWKVLLEYSNGLATIDNGQVKILNPNEVVTAPIPVINSDTGLLGSPRRSPTGLEFDLLFTPQMTLGQILQVESIVNPKYNGPYKVMAFNHRGTISPAVDRERRTTVTLFFGSAELQQVPGNVVL